MRLFYRPMFALWQTGRGGRKACRCSTGFQPRHGLPPPWKEVAGGSETVLEHIMNELTIGATTIHQQDGLFSLNDFHQASGNEKKYQPAFFLRNDQTKALIKEISSANLQTIPIKIIRGRGKAQGTYVCRELVIAYAAWISASFHLKVIQVFLDHAAPRPSIFTPAADQSKVSHLKLHVLDIRPRPDGRLYLDTRCGDLGFGVLIPKDFHVKISDCLMVEYPKEDNPLKTRFTAIYLEREQPVTCITPDWDWTMIGSSGLAALAAKCNQELAQRLGA
jgi:hypothetical protein